MRLLLAAIAAAAIVMWIIHNDQPEPDRFVANVGDGEVTPTMATTDVSTFISDSGYTKYHVTTPLWQMFEDAEDPFWKFPLGIFLEQYDTELQPKGSIVCDSAIYFSRKRLWQLDGNVVMVNTQSDSFLTQQLFWDQQSRKMYSDSFIHIVRTDRTIEGYGFESDQNMIYYTVHRPTAILPAERNRPVRRDTAARDSSVAPRPSATGVDHLINPTGKAHPNRPRPAQRQAPRPAAAEETANMPLREITPEK